MSDVSVASEISTASPYIRFLSKPLDICKLVTRVEFTSSVVQTLLEGRGGIIEIPTSSYKSLDVFEQRYWQYHTPYGTVGDEIWAAEKYKVTQVVATLSGFTVRVVYENGEFRDLESKFPVALTKADTWIPASNMPYDLSRLKLRLEQVVCSADYSKWQITVEHLNPNNLI